MKPSKEIRTHYLKICRGADGSGCGQGLDVEPEFVHRMERAVEETGWPFFLRERHGKRLNHHHGFRIHVTACPNGCAQPHIADIGLMRACRPQVDTDLCTGCGECAEGCPDQAIAMHGGLPAIDRGLCIDCGKCSLLCPVDAMGCGKAGWRVLAGGRLGRHPQLARELGQWRDDDGALAVVRRALEIYMAHYSPKKRFGRVLDDLGLEILEESGLEEDR